MYADIHLEVKSLSVYVVNFHFLNCRPTLTVNDVVHQGNMPMSPNMVLNGGPVYLGGVPGAGSLNADLPVKTSLMGGIHELRINDV